VRGCASVIGGDKLDDAAAKTNPVAGCPAGRVRGHPRRGRPPSPDKNALANFATFRRAALNVIKADGSKGSDRRMFKPAGWHVNFPDRLIAHMRNATAPWAHGPATLDRKQI